MEDYQFHRYANIWPLPSEQSPEFLALCDSLLKHGNQVPVTLYQNQILDGRTRYLAAKKHPDITLKFEPFNGTDSEALSLALALNNERRNLNESQRALAAFNFSRYSIEVDGIKANKADAYACEKFRASVKTVNRIAKVIKTSFDQPEAKHLIDAIATGDLTVTKAIAIINTLPPAIWEFVAYDEDKATKAIKEEKARTKELKEEREFSNGIKKESDGDFSGGTDHVYGVIYTDYATGVDLPAASNCVVFMWASADDLYLAVDRLIDAEFIDGKIYNFIRLTNGKMTSANVEHLICATKGTVPSLPVFQQNMVLNMKTGRPIQYSEVIGEHYTVPILAMFANQIKHKGDNWEYEPPLTIVEKPVKRNGNSKKAKTTTETETTEETVTTETA